MSGRVVLVGAGPGDPDLISVRGAEVLGRADVRAYWTRQFGVIDPRVEPVGFDTDSAGRTVVRVHQVVRNPAGAVISDGVVEHLYTIADGLITRMDTRKN